MAATTVSLSSLGLSPAIPVYLKRQNWEGMGCGLIVNFTGAYSATTGAPTGAAAMATASVLVTSDPNFNSTAPGVAATTKWIKHPVLTGLTADLSSSIGYPILAVCLAVTSYTSGTVTLQYCVADDI